MSQLRTIKTFECIEIKLDEIKEKDLIEIEDKIINIISQKLAKLSIITKEMNVYSHNGYLFINDRYKICKELKEIAEAFGFEVKEIVCPLRGANYIISEKLTLLLKQIGIDYSFGEAISNQHITEQIMSIVESNMTTVSIDENVLELLKNIRKNGSYTMSKKREVIERYEDNHLLSVTKSEWDFDEKAVQMQLNTFSKKTEKSINEANACMISGTTKLIYSRARQMGYAVEEVRKGKDVQLVLVRLQ
jgi:hypothetical protein